MGKGKRRAPSQPRRRVVIEPVEHDRRVQEVGSGRMVRVQEVDDDTWWALKVACSKNRTTVGKLLGLLVREYVETERRNEGA